jgi:hypothetical protein
MAKTLDEALAAVRQLEETARSAKVAEQQAKATREEATANLRGAWTDLQDALIAGAKASAIFGGELGEKLGVEQPAET